MSKLQPAAKLAHALAQIRQGRRLQATADRLRRDGERTLEQLAKELRVASKAQTGSQVGQGRAETHFGALLGSLATTFIPKRACEGAATVTVGDMEQCQQCDMCVAYDLVGHPFLGFASGCPMKVSETHDAGAGL